MTEDAYVFVELPYLLQLLPIEGFKPLLDECKCIMTTSNISIPLKYLYNIKTLDSPEILKKYNLSQTNNYFREIYDALDNYKGEGLLFSKKWDRWLYTVDGEKTVLQNVRDSLGRIKRKLMKFCAP